MKIAAIDSGRIESMLAQLKDAAQQRPTTQNSIASGVLTSLSSTKSSNSTNSIDFASALKSSLDQVNTRLNKAEQLGKSFALGDDSVSLSDVMIAGQKASISLQTSVQVRNKLVSAYHDIMNMQL
ncbi:MAG: flagellar hook-basal body complex protein FliE [Betaproteobacteria bacterium]|jgi:flagellar hook-basal body complex protein FliE